MGKADDETYEYADNKTIGIVFTMSTKSNYNYTDWYVSAIISEEPPDNVCSQETLQISFRQEARYENSVCNWWEKNVLNTVS
jgi:hypothetical protein